MPTGPRASRKHFELHLDDWGYIGPSERMPAEIDVVTRSLHRQFFPPNSLWAYAHVREPGAASFLNLYAIFFRHDGVLELARLILEPSSALMDESEEGIAAHHLRLVPLGELRRQVLAVLAHREQSDWGNSPLGNPPLPPPAWITEFEATPRPGRQGRPDLFYAQLAADYVDHLTSPTPVKDLAAERNADPARIRNQLNEARRRELLTASPRGQAGGQLTDKAKELLHGTR